tara:strand:- start:3364 stop:3594 length:231 start_codon:yes stop_codon:yes gene_type:complete
MVRYTRRLKYGGKKRKGTKKNKRSSPRRRSSPHRRSSLRHRRSSSRSITKTNENSWGLKKGSSKGCVRVCLGSTLR